MLIVQLCHQQTSLTLGGELISSERTNLSKWFLTIPGLPYIIKGPLPLLFEGEGLSHFVSRERKQIDPTNLGVPVAGVAFIPSSFPALRGAFFY